MRVEQLEWGTMRGDVGRGFPGDRSVWKVQGAVSRVQQYSESERKVIVPSAP
jgi:hypothetical protein